MHVFTRRLEKERERERATDTLPQRRPQAVARCGKGTRREQATRSYDEREREGSLKKCLGFGDGTKSLSAVDTPFVFSFIWPNLPFPSP